jgi:threonine/homoserine/homoserine lactone efflux protein
LLFLAYRFWTAPIEVEELGAIKKAGFFKGVLTGISVTLANPKAITFYLALMPAVLHLDEMSNQDFAIIAGTIAAILSLVLGSYIGFASRARVFFQAPNARRLLNRIAASVMGSAAILVASR